MKIEGTQFQIVDDRNSCVRRSERRNAKAVDSKLIGYHEKNIVNESEMG